MKEITVGAKLKCIFNQILPGNDHGPNLELDKEYTCKGIHLDSGGNPHIDVGLPLTLNFVKSYATKEELPGGLIHWCHPNRFVVIEQPAHKYADEGQTF